MRDAVVRALKLWVTRLVDRMERAEMLVGRTTTVLDPADGRVVERTEWRSGSGRGAVVVREVSGGRETWRRGV